MDEQRQDGLDGLRRGYHDALLAVVHARDLCGTSPGPRSEREYELRLARAEALWSQLQLHEAALASAAT
jgi:hypothetical protein